MKTALYRLFDEADALLYIGISNDPPTRWATHRCDHSWWPLVARKAVEWFDTRLEAAKAEAAAIRVEGPLHNKAIPNEDGLGGFRLATPRPKAEQPAKYRRFRMSSDLWDPFGSAVSKANPELDRSKVLRQMVRWYIGETNHLPRRPSSSPTV